MNPSPWIWQDRQTTGRLLRLRKDKLRAARSLRLAANFENSFLKAIFGTGKKSVIRGGFAMTYDRIGSQLAVAFDLNSSLVSRRVKPLQPILTT